MAVKVTIEGDASSVIQAFKLAGEAAGGFSQQVDHASEKTKGFSSVISGFAAGAGIAAFNLVKDSVGGIAQSMIGGAAEFQRYEVQFGVLLKSSTLAKDRLKELAEFGAKTPFELPEVVRADKILQGFGLHSEEAAAKFGFSGTQIRTIAGDLAAGTGSSFEEMATLLGKFSTGATGEAISRMAELGITSRDELAKMGLEFSKSGELLSPLPVAMETILKLTQDKFGGMMDKQSATLEGQLSNMQDAISGSLRSMGEAFLPFVTDAVKGITSGIAAIQPILVSFATQAGEGIKTIGPALQAIMPIFQGLIDIIIGGKEPLGDWSLWWESLAGIMGPNVATMVTDVIAQLQSLLTNIQEILTTIQAAWGTHKDEVVAIVTALTDLIDSVIRTVLSGIQDFWQENHEAITAIVQTTFAIIGEVVPRVINAIALVIRTVLTVVQAFWKEHHEIIEFITKTVFENIRIIVETVLGVIQGVLKLALDLIRGDWSAAWEDVKQIAQTVWDGIKALISNTLSAIQTLLTQAMPLIKAAWDSAWDSIREEAPKIGEAILKGIGQGLDNALGWLKDKARQIINDVVQAAKDALGISSPSKVFEEIGGQMAAGLAVGFGEGIRALPDSGMKNSLKDWGTKAGQAFSEGWVNWMATWNPMQGNVSIGGGGAPGAFRPTGGGGGLGGFGGDFMSQGGRSIFQSPVSMQAGFNNLAAAFSPGAMGVGMRSDILHQIDLAQGQLDELQKISAGFDLWEKDRLNQNQKDQALLEKLNSGLLTVGTDEFVRAITLSRSLVGNAGGVDDPAAALNILRQQAADIKQNSIDRKIAEDYAKVQAQAQLDGLKGIQATTDAQLQYLADIAANTAITAGPGGVFRGPPGVATVGRSIGAGGISLPGVYDDTPSGMAHRQPPVTVSIANLNVTADSVSAGQAIGKAVAGELEFQLANAMRRRNIGL